MRIKTMAIPLLATLFAIEAASAASTWVGLDESAYYSGPHVSPKDLEGKVVLVDCWGFRCGPCLALLPRMEGIWKKYQKKDFILLGSHCQGRRPKEVMELVRKNRLSYPIYDFAGIANPPGNDGFLPFMYVVDHRGRVVYSGRNEQEATRAIDKALKKIGMPPSLCGDVELKKYKSLENQLVLGKPVKQIVQKLTDDIKRCSSSSATASMRAQAAEARQILEAIESAKAEAKAEIEASKAEKPAEALSLAKAFIASFPEEGADYKAELPELEKRAGE